MVFPHVFPSVFALSPEVYHVPPKCFPYFLFLIFGFLTLALCNLEFANKIIEFREFTLLLIYLFLFHFFRIVTGIAILLYLILFCCI